MTNDDLQKLTTAELAERTALLDLFNEIRQCKQVEEIENCLGIPGMNPLNEVRVFELTNEQLRETINRELRRRIDDLAETDRIGLLEIYQKIRDYEHEEIDSEVVDGQPVWNPRSTTALDCYLGQHYDHRDDLADRLAEHEEVERVWNLTSAELRDEINSAVKERVREVGQC